MLWTIQHKNRYQQDVKPVKLTEKEKIEIKEIATGKTLENNAVYNSLISKETIVDEVQHNIENVVNEPEVIEEKKDEEPKVIEEKKETAKEEKKVETKPSKKKISRKSGTYNFTSVWNGVEMDSY